VSSWTLTLECPPDGAEAAAASLWEAGAAGLEIRDGDGTPMPGVAQPAPGRALLVAYFARRQEAEAAAAEHGGAVAALPDEDWSESWKRGLAPMVIGRAFVRPSWIDAPVPPGLAEVVLDPGMAFGTGSHPTTSLCLAALSDLLRARPGAAVLDVGTGSGLLAIAARRLGAGRVAGTDIDPVAVRVAAENAALNGVALELTTAPVPAIRGPFDLVVANILANTLVELAPAIAAQLLPGGVVLLSGILGPQEAEVRRAYLALGLEPLPGGDRREGEWSLLAMARPAG
jgi:ribosomal protein L11 methyltransferase